MTRTLKTSFKKFKNVVTFWRRRFNDAQINQVAASLAYTTVLALVPMLSLATVLIAKLPQFINWRETLNQWLATFLIPGALSGNVALYLTQFSSHAKGLTIFGLTTILLITFFTLSTIERAFNQVWQIKRSRPWRRRLVIYIFATLFGPVLLGMSVYSTSIFMTTTDGLTKDLSGNFHLLRLIFPFAITVLTFFLLYRFGPNISVRAYDAFWGGLCAAIIFESAKYGFTYFISKAPVYKTLYGAFAIAPLFLLWIYLTWWVTLSGAVLTASLPKIRGSFDLHQQ